jgi:hypothetical protein
LNQSGAWTQFSGSPLELFQATTVSYYGKLAASNAKSTIQHAAYQFTDSPASLDSDADGVPDYVELGKRLDPNQGADSDGNGYSDLEELLAGTEASNPASRPTQRLETRASFDLIETPRPLDGVANALTTSRTNTALRARDLTGATLASSMTTSNVPAPGVLTPAAVLSNMVIDVRQRLLSLATDPHFDVHTAHTNSKIGRELLGLAPVPELPQQLAVPYVFGGGNLLAEANAWIAAARMAQSNRVHAAYAEQLDLFDTLAALLVEKKIGGILVSRGLDAATNFTLFPFRPADVQRQALTAELLLAIELLGPNGEPAYLVRGLFTATTNALHPPNAFNTPLRNVAAEVYRISSALHDTPAGKFASPVDTLRQFLCTGTLPSNYLAHTTLTATALATAFASAAQILNGQSPRPTTNLALVVRLDTFTGACTVLDTVFSGGVKSLFHQSGEPFRLLENFDLPPGSQINVFGYTDVTAPACAGDAIEVITLALNSVPATSSADTDGDLLLDELEWFFFGGLGPDGSGDADNDGISDLQELLDGTDPKNARSKAARALNFQPQLSLGAGVNGHFKLSWDWPEAHANKVEFKLLSSLALGQPFIEVPGGVSHLGGGHFEITLPNAGQLAQFYRLSLALKQVSQ